MTESVPADPAQATPPEIDKSGPIRNFVDGGLAAAINRAVLAIPPDKHAAAVAFIDTKGAGVAYVAKLKGGWSLMAVGSYKWGGALEAQAAIQWMG